MSKIFKNLLPFWKMVIIIILLLLVQAWCDLSLPQYTSDIIDTGIQNKGIEHIVPQKITKEEFQLVQIFMTDKEIKDWKSSYKQEKDVYTLTVKKQADLDSLDEELSNALLFNYQLSSVDEATFRKNMAKQMGVEESALSSLSVEQIGEKIGVKLTTVQKETTLDGTKKKATYVDMRPIYQTMIEAGKMDPKTIVTTRDTMMKKMKSVGDTMAKSMGIQYAIQADKAAQVNVDSIQKKYLWSSGGKMIALALLMGAVTIWVGFFAAKIGAGIGRDLRGGIFQKVVRFSGAEMDKYSTASLITRSTNDIQQIQLVTTLMLRMVAYAPILGIGGVIKVIQTGAGMGWVIGFAVLLIFGLVLVLMVIAMPKFKRMQTLVDGVNLIAREILTGIPVIRAFGREKAEENRFEISNQKLTKNMLFTNRVMTFMMPVMMFIMYGLTVMIVWVGAHKINDGVLQVGAMTAFITYAMMIVMSFLMLTMLSVMLPRAGVAAQRIDEVLKTPFSIKEAKEPKTMVSHNGTLKFDHVNFKYPNANENALQDINFVAKPGETTAIIGSTGCGKSTLVNLIPRLYDATKGTITLDGIDITQLSLNDLRNEIGFVPQKGILFSGTIASNLRFGNPNASEEEIADAAAIAQATEFIDSKNEKYESEISQGGSNVSGGQKQRLAIARAIAKKPKIFVFDDSFSALDLKTDVALRNALSDKVKDSTVIIVAQRISTILHAEQILVLDEGKIVGKGTHDELMQTCEVYQQIAKSQLSATELGLDPGEGEL